MAHLYESLEPKSTYFDKKSSRTFEEWAEKLKFSTTVYVGNLAFFTTEDQVHELFGKCGQIKLVVMGLNRVKGVPCGFCFVQYTSHEEAEAAVQILNQTFCDERIIRVDWDTGENIDTGLRKFGRSHLGLQWRDVFRNDFDSGRGGLGGCIDFNEWNEQARRELRTRRKRGRDEDGRNYIRGQHGFRGGGAAPHFASVPLHRRGPPAGGAPGAYGLPPEKRTRVGGRYWGQ